MRVTPLRLVALICGIFIHATPALSQPTDEPIRLAQVQTRKPVPAGDADADVRTRTNNWTVTLLSSTITGIHIRMASDLQMVLDDGDNLRLLPVLGRGARQNVLDLLYLKGADVAYTYSDVFEELKKEGTVRNIEQRVQYISAGHLSGVNILVRPEIKTLKDLEGKKFGFHTANTGVSVSAPIIFERLGIKVVPVQIDNSIALEKMKSGELAGLFHLLPKGHDFLTKIPPELGFHLLGIEYDDKFADYYLPYTIDPGTYPNLMKPGEQVDTIGVTAVLAVYNWPKDTDRYRRVARFIEYYFTRFDQLKKPPFQPEWKNISLGAKVPGWTRFTAAEEMLEKMRTNSKTPLVTGSIATDRAPLDVGTGAQDPKQQVLFNEFLEWKKQQKK